MPYVNIPQSKLTGAIALVVGKLQGELSNKLTQKVSEVSTQFRADGCPTPDQLKRLQQQTNSIKGGINGIDNRIRSLRRIPDKLRLPISGLEKAISVIKLLPIPQSVPPGFGIPVSVTTKFADLLHLLKELVVQAKEDSEGITEVLNLPSNLTSSIQRMLGRLEGALKGCQVEAELQKRVADGSIDKQTLLNIGLIDEDGIYIFSRLGPIFVGNASIDSDGNLINDTAAERVDSTDPNSETRTQLAERELRSALQKLNNSNLDPTIKQDLRQVLNSFISNDTERIDNSKFVHTGPNGITYKLQIETDLDTNTISPRRFAIAKDPRGIIVLKGPKSFSSSEDILLEEIKFRIDNQLP